jgi:hypothetical protein
LCDRGGHSSLDRRGGKAIVCKRLDDPAMSILNVLLTRDHLVVAADTLAEDALTGAYSAGAKLLLIPQHNVVLAARGSTQFFLGARRIRKNRTLRFSGHP